MDSPDRLSEIEGRQEARKSDRWWYSDDQETHGCRLCGAKADWFDGIHHREDCPVVTEAAEIGWLIAQVKEWRQAAGAEADLADERGRRLHDRDHVLELCREEVDRLRDGIRAALDCHTETTRRVTLQELLSSDHHRGGNPP